MSVAPWRGFAATPQRPIRAAAKPRRDVGQVRRAGAPGALPAGLARVRALPVFAAQSRSSALAALRR